HTMHDCWAQLKMGLPHAYVSSKPGRFSSIFNHQGNQLTFSLMDFLRMVGTAERGQITGAYVQNPKH
ncbi:hypothetical protein, partial [Polaromonas sp.]|uniref:hypothetical protein n=2 Tax=Polaromonas sp. TaxID=1869339 RepID=UPI002C0346A6